MKVLFINPAPYKGRKYSIPNFGILYLIAYYQKYGRYSKRVKFKIYDENCESEKKLVGILKKEQFHVVGFSCTSLVVERAAELISLVRRHQQKALIVAGGIHFQVDPLGEIFPLAVDLAFAGEAEIGLQRFLDNLYPKRESFDKNKLKSLLKNTGKLSMTAHGLTIDTQDKIVGDLDFLTPKAFQYLNEKYYFRKNYELYPGKHGRILTMLFSRGCPFRCKFCFNSFARKPLRFHSPQSALKLIRYFYEKYRVRLVLFNDDLFMADKKRVTEFCQKLKSSKIKIEWACQGRADIISESDRGLLEKMREAGCRQICFGFETGSEKLLKYLKGPTSSVAKNQRAINLVNKSGIRVFGYFMIGSPTETRSQLYQTRKFIEKNLDKLAFYEVFIFTPLPGTELWQECAKLGILENLSFGELVINMFSMDYHSFRLFSQKLKKKDVYETKEYLKQLIVSQETLQNKVKYVWLNIQRDPKTTVRKAIYYLFR